MNASLKRLIKELKNRIEFAISLLIVFSLILFGQFLPEAGSTQMMFFLTSYLSKSLFFIYHLFVMGGFILLLPIFILWYLRKKHERLVSFVLVSLVVFLLVHSVYMITYSSLLNKQRMFCIKRAEKIISYLELQKKEKGYYPEKINPNTITSPGVIGVECYFYYRVNKDAYILDFTQGIGVYGFKWYDTSHFSDNKYWKSDVWYDVASGWKYSEREWKGPGFNF